MADHRHHARIRPKTSKPVTLFFAPYAANFDTMREADLPAPDVERILSGNARDLLNLRGVRGAWRASAGGLTRSFVDPTPGA